MSSEKEGRKGGRNACEDAETVTSRTSPVDSPVTLLSGLRTAVGSIVVSIVVFVAVFETIRHVEYYRWKRDFDSHGWLGKMTVPSQNPILMWEYRPSASHEMVTTNRFGFRERNEIHPSKPPLIKRIAFAGDSVTLGMGVQEDDTFVRRVERSLPPTPQTQTLNFSVDGYSALQVLELIRARVLDFEPDVVIYAMCLNDFDFEESSGDKSRYFRKPASFTWQTVARIRRELGGDDYHEYYFHQNRGEVLADLVRTRNLVQQNGSEFRVVIFPIFPAAPVTFSTYPLSGMHEEIGAFLLENSIPYVDLLPAFAAQGQTPEDYSFDVWHPNVAGHDLAARVLMTSGMLDPSFSFGRDR